jgi:hypothetical protein
MRKATFAALYGLFDIGSFLKKLRIQRICHQGQKRFGRVANCLPCVKNGLVICLRLKQFSFFTEN